MSTTLPRAVHCLPYVLCSQAHLPLALSPAVPDGWTPQPDLGLDRALPWGWDPVYRDTYRQKFQPVKLWQNAICLCAELDRVGPDSAAAQPVRRLVEMLLRRLREHTVWAGPMAFVENRFDFEQPGLDIPGPWVSAIANAFALLACCELRRRLPGLRLESAIAGYANAFHAVAEAGRAPPERWISYIDADGYLWFEEYPMPGERANLVLNGHVFAVLALFRACEVWPGNGYQSLVRAGATTIEARIARFRRRGKTNLYSLSGPRKGDYLPARTVRQQFQLYMLTGAPTFLAHARAFRTDMGAALSPEAQSDFDGYEALAVPRRALIDQWHAARPPRLIFAAPPPGALP